MSVFLISANQSQVRQEEGARVESVEEFDDPCDGRNLFKPRTEVPSWFWEKIAKGQQKRDLFQGVLGALSQAELKEFIVRLDELAGFFCEPPFVPPAPASNSEHYLEETGIWLVSQGADEFLRVWDQPERFWQLLADNV